MVRRMAFITLAFSAFKDRLRPKATTPATGAEEI